MYILQLNHVRVDGDDEESLVAVARSESLDHLSTFFNAWLNLDEDGITLRYYRDVLADGHTPCQKVFKRGSPLEYFVPPKDPSMLLVNLGTFDERLSDLIAELTKHTHTSWQAIVAGVVDIDSEETAMAINSLDVPVSGRPQLLIDTSDN